MSVFPHEPLHELLIAHESQVFLAERLIEQVFEAQTHQILDIISLVIDL